MVQCFLDFAFSARNNDPTKAAQMYKEVCLLCQHRMAVKSRSSEKKNLHLGGASFDELLRAGASP